MQVTEGESLETQQRQLAGYAAMHGFSIAQVFVEKGVSGSKSLSARPEGKALLELLQPGDVVLCAKLDRMFRSALDTLNVVAQLRERKVALHLLDMGGDVVTNGANALAKLFLMMTAAFAEVERDRIRERVLGTKADQRQRGRYLGGIVPFGYRVVGKGRDAELIEVPEQIAAIARMRALYDRGHSLRRVAAELQASGVKISHAGVKSVLDAQERAA
jgi:DNA invertase Pin-like site-specific DNA recombinase